MYPIGWKLTAINEVVFKLVGDSSNDPQIIRHSDPESLYGAALSCVSAVQAEGAKRRIDIASIHALAEHQAHRSSELTRALRDAMLERVREGWTLHRIVSITTQDGLARERAALDLIDIIPNARVEIRAIIVDAVPILAPLIVGTKAAFLASEDDRDFAAAEGLELRSRDTIDAAQRYFDLLWNDPRTIRLHSSASGTLESELAKAEAELFAFGRYQEHRRKSGLASGAAEDIEVYLKKERKFSAERELRRVLATLRGNVLWYEAHHSLTCLDFLADAIERHAVESVRLLSCDENIRRSPTKTWKRFETFTEEMTADGIACGWRIITKKETQDFHARVLLDDERAITIPPLNSLLRGTVDVIREAGATFDRSPYHGAYEHGETLADWHQRNESRRRSGRAEPT